MTSKPLSTITYCSNKFLNKTLKQLVADGVVTFWFYINHQPDADDKVPHTHLRIELGRPVDAEKIRKMFTQKKKRVKTKIAGCSGRPNWKMLFCISSMIRNT